MPLRSLQKFPLTNSIEQEIIEVIRKNNIPRKLQPEITGSIVNALDVIIEKGAKPVLSSIKDQPKLLVKEVKNYSPDKYLDDTLIAPYNSFLLKVQGL